MWPSTKPCTTTVATGRPVTPPSVDASADDEEAGRGMVALRARSGRRRQRQKRGACKEEEKNPAHLLHQSTPAGGGRNVRRVDESLSDMSPGALQDRSERLAALVEALGAALQSSGVADDAASRVLENASAAVLDALTLDLMFPHDPAATRDSASVEQAEGKRTIPHAA